MNPHPLAVGVFFAALAVAAPANELSRERRAELLQAAQAAFDQAVAATRENATRSAELYRQAASGFAAVAESGVRSAALEYNLGNAHFRLGELGTAILHYRRAAQIEPQDSRIEANLDYARRRVEPAISAAAGEALLDRLSFWNRNIAMHWRFRIALIGSIVGWGLLALWLKYRARPLVLAGVAVIVLGLANAASVAWATYDNAQRPHAVVIANNQTLRQGRGDAYEPVLKQALGAGVELRILQTRGDWVEVRLPDGQSGWLPLAGVMRV